MSKQDILNIFWYQLTGIPREEIVAKYSEKSYNETLTAMTQYFEQK